MKKTGLIQAMRECTDDELKGRMARLEEELFGHRMKRFTNQLANTALIRKTRREIAAAMTILGARKAGKEQRAAATEKPAHEEQDRG